MPPQKTEADAWRTKAEEALSKFSKAMDFFMFAMSQLVKMTELHSPDDYSHCAVCKVPWPCPTMVIVKSIGAAWTLTQKETR